MVATAATISVGLEGLSALHARELPQKDFLCGCFWASLLLRAAGAGESFDQDRVAEEAGSILPDADVESVPPGEEERRDYRLELPRGEVSVAGTAAPALAEAIERLSHGKLATVPVAGPWREESARVTTRYSDPVAALVETVADVAPGTTLIANVRTGPLWGARAHPSLLLDYLAGGDVDPPSADWDTGHFVNVAALARGPTRAALVVRDSYRSLGVEGHHVQPTPAFARALDRGDGKEGGVLCVVPAAAAEPLRERLGRAGYALRHWDNGTPYPVTR